MKGREKTGVRYVGIDLGKRTWTAAIVNEKGKVTMSNGQTTVEGRQRLYKMLRSGDKVALESGNMAFIMAKEIEAATGCTVYVLNALQLALIYGSMKKTDKEDSLKLAHILEDCNEARLPVVPVPSDQEMDRRQLINSYRRAQQDRNQKINLLHALFVHQGITTKVRKDLSTGASRREAIKELRGIQRREAEYLEKSLELCELRIGELEEEMEKAAAGDKDIERLQSIPGVGPKVAFAFVAYIAAVRFMTAAQVSNYLGLVPKVYLSGETVRYGRITKRGNGYLRALLVQGAWALTCTKKSNKLQERYKYMTEEKSKSKKKAIVAVARRLAEMMYTILRDGTRYEPKPFVKNPLDAKKMAQMALSA